MDINATLIGQFITFIILVWFTMKYVWPPITKAMQEREQRIADGLAAAERGKHELELAQHRATDQLREVKIQSAEIIEQANKRASQIVETAKDRAREEGERLLTMARADIQQELHMAKQQLRDDLARLVLASTEKLLEHSVNDEVQHNLVNKLIAEI